MVNLGSLYRIELHIFWKLVRAFHWKLPRKGLLEVKRLWKYRFFFCFSKVKTEKCDLRVWSVDMTIPCSAMKISVECSCLAQIHFYIFCRTKCSRFTKVAIKSFIVLWEANFKYYYCSIISFILIQSNDIFSTCLLSMFLLS